MIFRITTLLFVVGMAGGVATPVHAQDTLTVMSYNIYHGEQAYAEGKGNLEDVAALINEIQPDFVALQEMDEGTGRSAALNNGKPFSLIDSLASLTNMTGYFGKAIDFDGGGYGEGLLSKEPLASQKVMLPRPGGGEKRAVLYVKAKTPSGQPYIFAGTHLGHQYEENRVAQAKAINSYFEDKDWPIMMGGDFNFTPGSVPYTIIQKQWIDAAVEFGGQPEPTYSFESPRKRIDYLFLSSSSNWKVIDFQTVKVNYSDHLPIVAKVIVHPYSE